MMLQNGAGRRQKASASQTLDLRDAFVRSDTWLERWVFMGLLLWILWATTYLAPGAQVVGAVGFALLCVDVVMSGRRPRLGTPVSGWLVTFFVVACFSTLYSIWLGRSVATVQKLGLNILLFVFVVNALRRPSQTRFAVIALVLLLAVFPALGSIREFLAGAGRADWRGVFGAPNDLAAILVLFLPLGVAWRRHETNPWLKRFAELSVALLVLSIFVTGSRSGALGLILVGIWGVWTSRHRLRAITVGVAFLAVAEASGSMKIADRVESMFAYSVTGNPTAMVGEDESNWAIRKEIWGVALEIVGTRPILGTGPGTFEEAHSRHADPSLISGGQRWRDTHNSFLRVWSESGTLGLVAFLGIWLGAFHRGQRAYRRGKRILGSGDPAVGMLGASMIGVAAFLICNFFNTFYDMWLVYFSLGLIVVLAREIHLRSRVPTTAPRPPADQPVMSVR